MRSRTLTSRGGTKLCSAAGAIVALLPLTDYDCTVASPKDRRGEDALRNSILPERCDFFEIKDVW